MKFEFYKYEVCGNDFVIINNLGDSKTKINSNQTIKKICDRNFGIGADGLIFIENDNKYDFEMIYHNSDGIESSLCGNGARACIDFVCDLKKVKEVCFKSTAGIHFGRIDGKNKVYFQLQDVFFKNISFIKNDYVINTGSPHYVKFVDDLNKINFLHDAKKIRNNNRFIQKGINVNFTQKIIKKDFQKTNPLRGFYSMTYERGVEAETLSCGTGAAAIAVALFDSGVVLDDCYRIIFKGGEIKVSLSKNSEKNKYDNIFLSSSVNFVFKGTYSK